MTPNQATGETAELRENQRFLDATIHCLRGALRGIGISAGLLSQEENARLDERSKALLSSILEGVTKIDNLATSLACYSMALLPDQSSFAPLPVENALQTALAALRARIAETGAAVHSGALPRVRANHDQLAVLFRCLLSNALEYRSGARPPRIEISASRADGDWHFAVSDNGIGIAPRYQQQVLEPFQRLQSHPPGLGLGLAICRKIVQAHGGRIWIESAEGEGATFFFTLPADGAEAKQPQQDGVKHS